MKTKSVTRFYLLSFVFYLVLTLSPLPCALSQIPQGFNYQAIARGSDGKEIANTTIQVKIGILSDTLNQTIVWEELHNPIKTNAFGLFSLVIGSGVKQSGSAPTFSEINWKVTPLFIKTQIYYLNNWKYMGSAKLWSVPYSMIASDLEGSVKKLEVVGADVTSDEALFEVKRNDGETMFAVYNHGVRVFMPLDTLSKAKKGGFAIGGFSKTKGIIQEYFVVNPDSIRAYIDTNPPKGKKGGFAIGGFDKTKAGNEEYLRVTRDSTRIYVNDQPTKGTKGGFAIGGFSTGKGTIIPFTSLTPDNYFIGHRSGVTNTTGLYNSFVGFETGQKNISGSYNVFLGYRAGYSNTGIGSTSSSYNVFIGSESGFLNATGSFNTFLGYQTGYDNTSGSYNVFLGYGAGMKNLNSRNVYVGYESGVLSTNGYNNVFLGYWSGKSNTTGHDNVFLGTYSGNTNSTGINNAFVGIDAGSYNTSGGNNSFYGAYSGYKNTTSSFNTFMGYRAGYENTIGSSNVFLGTNAGEGSFGIAVTGSQNVIIGSRAGLLLSTGQRNIILGSEAGHNITAGQYNQIIGYYAGYSSTGSYNVFMGPYAGYSTTSSQNIFAGYNSGRNNTTGYGSVFLGYESGYTNTTGGSNVFIGQSSGRGNSTGVQNVYLGNSAGYGATGSYNVFIGTTAGYSETGSNKLIITNTTVGTPLIYGDFGTRLLTLNAEVISRSPNYNGFRLIGGTYGTILRNDGSDFYLLVTNSGDALGSWNGLRPFSFRLSTGEVNFGNNVGIGNPDPYYPLHVESSTLAYAAYGYLNSAGNTGTSSGNNYYSIFAQQRIRAEEFNADSDIRIKKVKGISDSYNDLEILKKIRVTDFTYIDSISKGDIVHKKVIAQELKEVYPNAVTASRGFIPSVYAKPVSVKYDYENKRMIITLLKEHGLKTGDNIKFIEPDGVWNAEVSTVISANTFCVGSLKDRSRIFVYGKEVNDFLTVDYEAISMLNVSATQELFRKMDDQQQKIESQDEKIARLEKMVEELQAVVAGGR